MKFPVFNLQGEKSGQEVELPDDIVKIEPHKHAIYLAVKRQLVRTRQGTSSTKTRSEVRGGGRKPWRQKGSGAARAGTIRSPIWRGGGRAFGPKPHPYDVRLPAKVKKLARRSALAARAQDGGLRIVEDFNFDKPEAKNLFGILKGFRNDKTPVILLLADYNTPMHLSARNIPHCTVQKSSAVSTYELIRHKIVLLQKSAVEPLVEVLKNA
ncbi:50S ribosomal protein L4 [candidate division LCP-89 bacterium B3_LCP]|uniref:Large ribosomal subunit protein uL4 n=1 Tax=candidate division LCP-89 bacterium B3_LCP TaxID=2012998 RepID=A0A532V0D2_UNCL8|nr:MAG: 50S ribosomal protein L4 [candidate division LCP-89 bacterium B3_LCP]